MLGVKNYEVSAILGSVIKKMMENINAMVGERVRKRRIEMSLPRRIISEQTNISERYLSQLEKGQANISLKLIERIAEVIEVSVSELVKGPDVEISTNALANFVNRLDPAGQRKALQLLKSNFEAIPRGKSKGIALIGLRGAGKSTLGQMLANELELPFINFTDLVSKTAGMPVSDLASLGGQDSVHRHELEAMQKLVKEKGGNRIVEASEDLPQSGKAFDLMLKNYDTIWIKASPEEHIERVAKQNNTSISENKSSAVRELKHLLQSRQNNMARAHVSLDTSEQSVDESAAQLIQIARQII